MSEKIVAIAVFLDFGIVDSIRDKHRKYPASFVIPMAKVEPCFVLPSAAKVLT